MQLEPIIHVLNLHNVSVKKVLTPLLQAHAAFAVKNVQALKTNIFSLSSFPTMLKERGGGVSIL